MTTLENFLASATYADSTIITYRSILTKLLENTDPANLDAAGLVKFVKSNKSWGNSRQCVALAACQRYLRWAYGDDHPALIAKIKRITGKPQPALDKTTAMQLLANFDRYTAKGARDLAICTLALDTGLRASELCRITLPYVDLDRCTLQDVIKGGQWSAAVFSPETAAHIRHWLGYRKTVNGPGYLFLSLKSGGKLSVEGLRKAVNGWGREIGIQLTTHTLRRSFATLATEVMGAPERVLMEGGRWAHSDMIKRYTRTLQLNAMRKYLPTQGLKG